MTIVVFNSLTLLVSLLTLGALVWYAIETKSTRIASQNQVRISQKQFRISQKQVCISQKQVRISQELLKASMDQVEGLSKPCLTLCADLRDPRDAIWDQASKKQAATMVARTIAGRFAVENIGNGVALNVTYRIIPENGSSGSSVHKSYIQNVLAGQRVSMPESTSNYASGEYKVIFEYESIGARRYRTTLEMSDLALTAFFLEEVTTSADQP